MAANSGLLAGKTLFITGASRGIGKAIALKAAKDGANIVIAAKTTTPHPKLPGTIYTAAKEVEEAGGKCLPCAVDIRNDSSVQAAMKEAADKFGGIDILVNNASAISLTGTDVTDPKRFDLMMGINARGTYMCSKFALPYLQKSSNPHILNISPPLNMNPRWFKDHVAYTMAKYGMSMCVLGMSGELKPLSIAVNALWPRTAIYTAAMEMLGGGSGVSDQCRKPEIMSDAAYVILTKKSSEYTGNFTIDDEVLRSAGVSDLEQYSCVPGTTLLPDFFLDGEDPHDIRKQMEEKGGTPAFGGGSQSSGGGPAKTFNAVKGMLNEDLVSSMNGVFQFKLTGADEGMWYMDLKSGSGKIGQGEPPNGADCTMTLDSEDFVKMFKGELKAVSAFMSGKLKIQGDMGLAMKLEKLMNKMDISKL
ncbi:hydroxysteroid dehydrogenase-like protein 2 isoform X2 [Ostrea edulis]|uniref:hydroxysteroid dehydrogenase-like protein 2 isoform X2 n=1 Tax=Ostrea edulis TaxID=37623 RepID=UPI0024AFB269|nr:hydroxysteroid dehydrogenase-like protein 2 isoform X2 [Ostrea edulis]